MATGSHTLTMALTPTAAKKMFHNAAEQKQAWWSAAEESV